MVSGLIIIGLFMKMYKVGDDAFRVKYDPKRGRMALDYWYTVLGVLQYGANKTLYFLCPRYACYPNGLNQRIVPAFDPFPLGESDYPTHPWCLFDSEEEAQAYCDRVNP